ncbi:unnamed protein product, partial [Musa acuminata subsp. malaccensis]
HIAGNRTKSKTGDYKRRSMAPYESIPFSAFWLRSSVVSVLISLISDTWVIDSP